jgi:hypothetical protein
LDFLDFFAMDDSLRHGTSGGRDLDTCRIRYVSARFTESST